MNDPSDNGAPYERGPDNKLAMRALINNGVNINNLKSGSVIIEHIPAGITPTGSLEAAVPVSMVGYSKGTIYLDVNDVTPAGDLAGTFDIAYSMDGESFTDWETLATIANIGADDTQDFKISFSDLTPGADAAGFTHVIKDFPFFKIRESITGTLAAVTIEVSVFMER